MVVAMYSMNDPGLIAHDMEINKMLVQNHPKLLYPSMVIASIAVTVFSLLGIATLTGAMPFAHSETQEGKAYEAEVRADEYGQASAHAVPKKIAASCSACGTVESVRAVEVKGNGSGIGAVAGGVTGALLGNGMGQGNGRTAATLIGAAGGAYAGNEIEKNTKKHTNYRIRVRMGDDSVRTLYQRAVPGVSAGDRVKIVDGSVVQLS
jgi:outer membrane lipoprotein SlyB